LLGLSGLLLLFGLYYCFCKKRYPTYYNQGFGGAQVTPPGAIGAVPGAQNFGGMPGAQNFGGVLGSQNFGAYANPGMVLPGQPGFAGNMVQGGPLPGSNINPALMRSALRLSRNSPTGLPPGRF